LELPEFFPKAEFCQIGSDFANDQQPMAAVKWNIFKKFPDDKNFQYSNATTLQGFLGHCVQTD
jgi:hypothetical protein